MNLIQDTSKLIVSFYGAYNIQNSNCVCYLMGNILHAISFHSKHALSLFLVTSLNSSKFGSIYHQFFTL